MWARLNLFYSTILKLLLILSANSNITWEEIKANTDQLDSSRWGWFYDKAFLCTTLRHIKWYYYFLY